MSLNLDNVILTRATKSVHRDGNLLIKLLLRAIPSPM